MSKAKTIRLAQRACHNEAGPLRWVGAPGCIPAFVQVIFYNAANAYTYKDKARQLGAEPMCRAERRYGVRGGCSVPAGTSSNCGGVGRLPFVLSLSLGYVGCIWGCGPRPRCARDDTRSMGQR